MISTPASERTRSYTPFRRAISRSLLASSVFQSKRGSPSVQPKLRAISKSSRKCAAYEKSFFGMQPTFTQVPPNRPDSAIATLAP